MTRTPNPARSPTSRPPTPCTTPQPRAVPAVVRLQVARAAADGAGREPDRAGHHHPGGRDHVAGPDDQDRDGVARRRRAAPGRPAPRRTALRRTRPGRGLPAVLFLFSWTRTGLAALPLLSAGGAGGGGD